MTVQYHNLFPTLVREVKNFLTENECVKIASSINKEQIVPYHTIGGDGGTNYGYISKFIDTIDPKFKIQSRLSSHLQEMTDIYGTTKVVLTNSWASIQRKDSILHPHTHSYSVFSGVLYLKTDENSSSLAFYNPNPFVDFLETKQSTAYNYRYSWIKPEIGTLLLFPSWLKHGSIEPNRSDERIIISFNTTPI
jgi:uncharacterized protein (TIGR02466 family)